MLTSSEKRQVRRIFVAALITCQGCATIGKGGKSADNDDATSASTVSGIFDWLPLEARLEDTQSPVASDVAANIARLRAEVNGRDQELKGWVLPLFHSYLPAGEPQSCRVIFELGRQDAMLVTNDGKAYIDVAAPAWKGDEERLWDAALRALYTCDLQQALPFADEEPSDADEFADHVLTQVMTRGLATYVAAQGRPLAGGASAYQVPMSRDEVSERFQDLDDLMQKASGAKPREIQILARALVADETTEHLFDVVGAYMADAIEQRLSRNELMVTVERGPRAFFKAYADGRPGAMVNFRLPGEAPKEHRPSAGEASH